MTRRTGRISSRFAQVFLGIVGLFLVIRGIVELFITHLSEPATYRHDWGGPHYLGVIAVHSGPGLLIVGAACWYVAKRRRACRAHGD